MLKRKHTHICVANPKELIQKFMRERSRERPKKNIPNEVRAEYVPEDSNLFPPRRRRALLE